jgi:hypothetical protein
VSSEAAEAFWSGYQDGLEQSPEKRHQSYLYYRGYSKGADELETLRLGKKEAS